MTTITQVPVSSPSIHIIVHVIDVVNESVHQKTGNVCNLYITMIVSSSMVTVLSGVISVMCIKCEQQQETQHVEEHQDEQRQPKQEEHRAITSINQKKKLQYSARKKQ